MSQQLNLPEADLQVRVEGDQRLVWDIVRRKYVVLTPEEWVRQQFMHFLINQNGYPRSLMKVESGLRVNKMNKRSDLMILGRDGFPWMLVECKSPYVAIDQDALVQAVNYNRTYRAAYLVLTNGMEQIICKTRENSVEVVEKLPPFPEAVN